MTSTEALLREWHRKLKASGFQDIERPDGQLARPTVRGDSRRSWGASSVVERQAVRGYFEVAEKFWQRRAFRALSKRQRAVWRAHTRGLSNAQAAKLCRCSLKAVRHTLKRCRRLAGLPESTSSFGHGRGA